MYLLMLSYHSNGNASTVLTAELRLEARIARGITTESLIASVSEVLKICFIIELIENLF